MNDPLEYMQVFTIPFRVVFYSLIAMLITLVDDTHMQVILTGCIIGIVHFELYQVNHHYRLTGKNSTRKSEKRLFYKREFAIPSRWILHTVFVVSLIWTIIGSDDIAKYLLILMMMAWLILIFFEVLQGTRNMHND